MSAFQVTGKHIAVLVDASLMVNYYGGFDGPDTFNRLSLCKMLAEENAKSVNYRYSGKPSLPVDRFGEFNRKVLKDYSLFVLLKAIDCYEYQACEHEGWKDSEAKAFCSRLRKSLISRSPEYTNAEGWGIS